MASREVKPAMGKMAMERGNKNRGTVKAAMTPPKEERGKKETRKPKRAMGR